jgi:shikimate kinase
LNRIALVGFMGAGKTTVGRTLAAKLGWSFLDQDQELEKETGGSIGELFAEGEEHFRILEGSILSELLTCDNLVLATGGGVVGRQENLELLLSRSTVVYLKVPVELLWERTGGEAGARLRPLLKDGYAQFCALFKAREPSYCRAQIIVDGRGQPEEVAQKIMVAWRDLRWT